MAIIGQTIMGKNQIEALIADIYYNLWKIKNEVYPVANSVNVKGSTKHFDNYNPKLYHEQSQKDKLNYRRKCSSNCKLGKSVNSVSK